MSNDTLFVPRSIGYFHDPSEPDFFKKPLAFDNDLLLFSAFSESSNHIPFDRITIIGGRSLHGFALPGKRLADVLDLSDDSKELFIRSLYDTHEKAIIIPLKNKILVIYNQLLRSNGLGIALIFDYSPRCVSALIGSGALSSSGLLISPAFHEMSEKREGASSFLSSLSSILQCLKNSDTFSRFEPKCDIKEVTEILNSASDLIGCPISVNVGEIFSEDVFIDRPTLLTFAICLLSKARRLSKDRRITVSISAKELFSISAEFTLYSKYSETDSKHILAESDFCHRMATEMGIPFNVNISDDIFKSAFIPYRADPSVLGFKAGIFIDGKRFTRLP